MPKKEPADFSAAAVQAELSEYARAHVGTTYEVIPAAAKNEAESRAAKSERHDALVTPPG